MSIPTIVNENFDRGIMLWLSSACNEFYNIKGAGTYTVKSFVIGALYTISVNGETFSYTTVTGDTEESILNAFITQINGTYLGLRYDVALNGSNLTISATQPVYGLYCLNSVNMSYAVDKGIVVIWVNQNAYGAVKDFKPPYPYVTVEVTSGTNFGTDRLMAGDDAFDNTEDITNTVRINYYSVNRYNQFAERVSRSYNRHVYMREYLRPNGISCFGILSMNDTSELLNSKTDLRMTIDMSFNYVYEQSDSEDLIGVVEEISVNDDDILVSKDGGVINP